MSVNIEVQDAYHNFGTIQNGFSINAANQCNLNCLISSAMIRHNQVIQTTGQPSEMTLGI